MSKKAHDFLITKSKEENENLNTIISLNGQVDIANFDAEAVCKSCVLDSIAYYKNQIIVNGGNNPNTGNVSVNIPNTGNVSVIIPTINLRKKEQVFEEWVNFGLFVAVERNVCQQKRTLCTLSKQKKLAGTCVQESCSAASSATFDERVARTNDGVGGKVLRLAMLRVRHMDDVRETTDKQN